MKILTIGGATQDLLIRYEDAQTMHLHTKKAEEAFLMLKEGGKVEVNDIIYSSGGGANNAAFSFKKQGFDVSALVKIGPDEQGKFVITKLKEAGINTDLIIMSPQGQTGISFVIPCPSGDRTILAFRGVNGTITDQEIPYEKIKDYDYLYITSLSGASSQLLLPIVQEAKKHKIPVATNPGTSQLIAGAPILVESLPHIDIVILNSSEAKTLMLSLANQTKNEPLNNFQPDVSREITPKQTDLHAQAAVEFIPPYPPGATSKTECMPSCQSGVPAKSGDKFEEPFSANQGQQPALLGKPICIEGRCFSLENFFASVLSYGPSIVVVTNGNEGVYVATKNSIYFHPSLPVKAINTLGAGDAFGSSFVGALASGHEVEQAIRHGIINSGSVIGYLDTKQGLLSMQELERKAGEMDPSLLQQFPLRS